MKIPECEKKRELCGGNARLAAESHASLLNIKPFFLFNGKWTDIFPQWSVTAGSTSSNEGFCLMFAFCLQSGEMIRTHGREKRAGRSSVWVHWKSNFDTGPWMQSGLTHLCNKKLLSKCYLKDNLDNFSFHQIQLMSQLITTKASTSLPWIIKQKQMWGISVIWY